MCFSFLSYIPKQKMGACGYSYKLPFKKSLSEYLIKKNCYKIKGVLSWRFKVLSWRTWLYKTKRRKERIMDLLLIWSKLKQQEYSLLRILLWPAYAIHQLMYWGEWNCERPASTDNAKWSNLDYKGPEDPQRAELIHSSPTDHGKSSTLSQAIPMEKK